MLILFCILSVALCQNLPDEYNSKEQDNVSPCPETTEPIFDKPYPKIGREVTTYVEQGVVQGVTVEMPNFKIQRFLGIPYAEPPLGKYRFTKSVKRSNWGASAYQATEYKSACIQFMDYHTADAFSCKRMRNQSEDCLYLNVFSPQDSLDPTRSHPVLIWIHGGSLLAGSGDTGIHEEVAAVNLVRHGVVLVTINYRLGPLGFATYKDEATDKLKGNWGIYDIKLALEWVHTNIRHFNGDPAKVTIMGESAGAAAVSVLATSPLTKRLVHRAIILSGSATAPWALLRKHETSEWDITNILKYMRCDKRFDTDDTKRQLQKGLLSDQNKPLCEHCNCFEAYGKGSECVHALDIENPFNAADRLKCLQNHFNLSNPIFRKGLTAKMQISRLVVDNELIVDYGNSLLRNYSRIPIMIGVARNEWGHKKAIYYDIMSSQNFNDEAMKKVITRVVEGSYLADDGRKLSNSTKYLITNATLRHYISQQNPKSEWTMQSFFQVLQKIEADIEFVAPAHAEMIAYAMNNISVYAFVFDYVPQSDIVEQESMVIDLFGQRKRVQISRKTHFKEAFHGLDHGYIFTRGYTSNLNVTPYTERDEDMAHHLCTLITNFVKNGDPNEETNSTFHWPKYTAERRTYVELDLPSRVVHNSDLLWPAPEFWNAHVAQLAHYIDQAEIGGGRQRTFDESLDTTERQQLEAYRRAWIALWILVATLVVVLWLAVLCIALRRCSLLRTKPYDNIVVTKSQGDNTTSSKPISTTARLTH